MPLSWNHNDHYHDFLLRRVPAGCERALDVGCGAGRFARALAARAGHVRRVDALDPSPQMLEQARQRTPPRLGVRYTLGTLADVDPQPGAYGFVAAVSSVHHMPFVPALRAMASAVAPGGVLAIVGLYRHETAADYATTAAAILPQWGIGAGLRAARAITGVAEPLAGNPDMPARDPDMSLREIAAGTGHLLPDARLRRHLFWRYSLVWARPRG